MRCVLQAAGAHARQNGRMTGETVGRAAGVQRTVGAVVLLLAGALSLPLSATVLDGPGTENLVLPAQFLVMAVLGAVTVLVLPALAPAGASRGRALLVGAALGLAAALVGTLVFWFLLNGLGGA